MHGHLPVVIIDFEKHFFAVDFERTEIMVAMGGVVGGEGVKTLDRHHDFAAGLFGQGADAGGADHGPADKCFPEAQCTAGASGGGR